MSIPEEFIIPYTLSNIIAVLLLLAAWKVPRIARVLFFLLFAWASWTNSDAVLSDPSQYLNYSQYALLPFYKNFINGFFSEHVQEIVLTIAGCQLCIAICMLLKGWIFNIGSFGAILFFISIAPLGVGAAFPSSIIGAIAILILLNKNGQDYSWKKQRV